MADAYTDSGLFNAPGHKSPDEPTVDESYRWEDDFARRMTEGQLSEADDRARVQGRLGGVTDPVELSDKIRKASGGHDNIWPMTNPAAPAAPAEAPLHPGVANSPDLLRDSDLEKAKARHEEAKSASEKAAASQEKAAKSKG